MKKLDDAKRRVGVPAGVVGEGEYVFTPEEICKHFRVPVELLSNVPSPIRLDGTSQMQQDMRDVVITRQKQEIAALNKLLDERDELLDQMVSSPAELHGWVMCLILIMTVFLAHGLGYL